jgi:hypothetical protein
MPLAKLGLPELQAGADEPADLAASSLIECASLWFSEPVVAAQDGHVTYRVEGRMDGNTPARVREHLEKYYADLEKEIKRAFPDIRVSLRVAADRVVLSGQARDLHEMARVLRIVAPEKEQPYNK